MSTNFCRVASKIRTLRQSILRLAYGSDYTLALRQFDPNTNLMALPNGFVVTVKL
ncbi:MAG: hypothetical protein FWE27_09960 [Defluviitaleaceae bacterium]|nr:hypothetical protein [Defluviitaleaceae bacterium]